MRTPLCLPRPASVPADQAIYQCFLGGLRLTPENHMDLRMLGQLSPAHQAKRSLVRAPSPRWPLVRRPTFPEGVAMGRAATDVSHAIDIVLSGLLLPQMT